MSDVNVWQHRLSTIARLDMLAEKERENARKKETEEK